jgi:hypothetical protein
MNPLLQTAFQAVENGTALNASVVNSPATTVSVLTTLRSTLASLVPGDILSSLDSSISDASISQSSMSGQIGNQLADLTSNIQTYGHLNEVRLAMGEITQSDVGSDITTYFGSIMLPNMTSKVAQRRMDRLAGVDDQGNVLPDCQEVVTADTVQTIRDEVAQISGYTTQMLTQSVTEPNALAAASTRLINLSTASVLTDYLQVPATFPILDIVAGDGLRPVVDAVKYDSAISNGFDGDLPPDVDPDNPVYPPDLEEAYYGVPASDEQPTPPSVNSADPVPPPG